MRIDHQDEALTRVFSALTCVTVGALLTIWSGLWLGYQLTHDAAGSVWTYIAVGLVLSGVAFFGGGLAMGLLMEHAEEQAEDAS